MTPDMINGSFELGGAAAISLSIRRILIDKQVSGVSWGMIAFMLGWGVWTLYFYSYIEQPWSLLGSDAIVVSNVTYLALLLWYGYVSNRDTNRDTKWSEWQDLNLRPPRPEIGPTPIDR